jgi:hypothetical protein
VKRLTALVAMMALAAGAVQAQDATPPPRVSLADLSRAAVVPPEPTRTTGTTQTPPAARRPRRKDSLLNGILIGAGLGAIAGAAIGTAAIGCDQCAGFNVPLTFGVVGAAAGAALGAGLDALIRPRSRVAPRASQYGVHGTRSRG